MKGLYSGTKLRQPESGKDFDLEYEIDRLQESTELRVCTKSKSEIDYTRSI